jgi:hypothetical protein
MTNAGVEAVNATIQWVKKTARGFRNVEHSCLSADRSRLRSTFSVEDWICIQPTRKPEELRDLW